MLGTRERRETARGGDGVDAVPGVCIALRALAQHRAELDATQSIVRLRRHGLRKLQVVAFRSPSGASSVYNLGGATDVRSLRVAPQVAGD